MAENLPQRPKHRRNAMRTLVTALLIGASSLLCQTSDAGESSKDPPLGSSVQKKLSDTEAATISKVARPKAGVKEPGKLEVPNLKSTK
jgi:hypothetical protein